MGKQEILDWIEQLKAEGYDDDEIEQIIQSYLDQAGED